MWTVLTAMNSQVEDETHGGLHSAPPFHAAKALTRRAYHPDPPANRSPWVMWVGNVPKDTTTDELLCFFSSPACGEGGHPGWPPSAFQQTHGVHSVFLISRSNCAFVNYDSDAQLRAAVARFDGTTLRPASTLKLVCRVRNEEDNLRAGVGGQRGMGLHRQWIEEQRGDSGMSSSTEGSQSTSSSMLQAHFPHRYFILKALSQDDLDTSVQTGSWTTQKHNEGVLVQAFRTAKDVFIFFSANKSGRFYGYARIAGIEDNSAPVRPSTLKMLSSQHQVDRSPSPLPDDHDPMQQPPSLLQSVSAPPILADKQTNKEPLGIKFSLDQHLARKVMSHSMDAPAAEPEPEYHGGGGEDEEDDNSEPRQFRLEWIDTRPVPFQRTKDIRNPWNGDREVKISRDGTELEPSVGAALRRAWDALP
ncbi:unnamed protein product [Mycena citricolor]|uniref:YTH domain-containing protein n=1 Tax=Mycena citricolor TaxID=2018698 RepID=A0AAD2H7L9_9AGAR|nr:unnamed protein product [Mycena citricolor]